VTVNGATAALPDFEDPPIVEALASVEFQQLPLSTLDLGDLVRRWLTEYPQLSEQPVLPPTTAFGPANGPLQFTWGGAVPSVRFWAESADSQWLAQLQGDRVVINWRRVDERKYPGFNALFERVTSLVTGLVDFVAELGREAPVPLLAEYTYVNRIEAAPSEYTYSIFTEPRRAIPGVELYTGFRMVREVESELGRAELTITGEPIPELAAQSAVALNETTRVFLTSNSSPDTIGQAIRFAHETSRTAFTAVTSLEMQQQWGRN
jgi:uncharacterized protein (TIGR04255 family)